jgi:maleylpyruvate isomerase
MRAPSRLPDWSRDLVVAHLRFGAEAALRGIHSAISQSGGLMYPGGDQQRDDEIATGRGRPTQDLIAELADACTRLENTLSNLTVHEWEAAVQTRRGPVPVRQVLVQRWLDVEVHHVDLDVGYTAADWPIDLVDAFLPAMIAMLPALRARPDADHAVNGSWVFRRTDRSAEWVIWADNNTAWQDAPRGQPDVTLSGNGDELLAVLLGRSDVTVLDITGSRPLALHLKRAFPGP